MFGLIWLGSAWNGLELRWIRLDRVGFVKVIFSWVLLGLEEFSLVVLDLVGFVWLVFGCLVLVRLELGIDNDRVGLG